MDIFSYGERSGGTGLPPLDGADRDTSELFP